MRGVFAGRTRCGQDGSGGGGPSASTWIDRVDGDPAVARSSVWAGIVVPLFFPFILVVWVPFKIKYQKQRSGGPSFLRVHWTSADQIGWVGIEAFDFGGGFRLVLDSLGQGVGGDLVVDKALGLATHQCFTECYVAFVKRLVSVCLSRAFVSVLCACARGAGRSS